MQGLLRSKELWEYKYPEDPPEHYYWMKIYEWSCPYHDYDVNEDEGCGQPCCIACRSCETARNIWTGEWRLCPDLLGLCHIMQTYYLPAIREQLNSEVLLLELPKHSKTGQDRKGSL